MKSSMVAVLMMLAIAAIGVSAQRVIQSGSKLFVEKMDGDLDGFIRAEIIRQRVPLTIVMAKDVADLVMTGNAQLDEKTAWHEGLFTSSKNHATGNVLVVDRASNAVLWAAQAGDKGFWSNNGGPGRVAKKIVGNLKGAIRGGLR